MKKVTFITPHRLPKTDPSAVRVLSLCKMLYECGYEVQMVGRGYTPYQKIIKNEYGSHVSLRFEKQNILSKILDHLTMTLRFKRYITKKCSQSDLFFVDAGGYFPKSLYRFISSFAKKRKIQVVYDIVEYHSPSEFKLGSMQLYYRRMNYVLTKHIKNPERVISVSNYINDFFLERGVQSFLIPIIRDKSEEPVFSHPNNSSLTFIYSGTRTKSISKIIGAFSMLSDNEITKVKLIIVGRSEKDLINSEKIKPETVSKLGKSLIILNRMPREEIFELYRSVDFTLIFGPSTERYAKSFFPTRMTESLFLGIPVITNDHSDVAKYISTGLNGILVSECTSKSLSDGIKMALNMSDNEIKNLRVNSRKTAENQLDYRNYLPIFKKAISK